MFNDPVNKNNKIREKVRNVAATLKTYEEIDSFEEEEELAAVLETDKICCQPSGMSQRTINSKNLQWVTMIEVRLLIVLKRPISYFMLEQLLLSIAYEEEKTNKQVERNQCGEE